MPANTVVTDTATRVLSAYPEHALIERGGELARDHLTWHRVGAVRHGGEAP